MMNFKLRPISVLVFVFLLSEISAGCNSLGMMLFYRDSKTSTVFKSSTSHKNYYVIKATTLAHCGCTDLYVDNYTHGKKDFHIFYSNNIARKTIFGYNEQTHHQDTLRLLATPYDNFTISFDSLDQEIFRRIDSISIQKPKGIVYQVKRPAYKGYIKDPNLNY